MTTAIDPTKCPECAGSGRARGMLIPCSLCLGSGRARAPLNRWEHCKSCQGGGRQLDRDDGAKVDCSTCHGRGEVLASLPARMTLDEWVGKGLSTDEALEKMGIQTYEGPGPHDEDPVVGQVRQDAQAEHDRMRLALARSMGCPEASTWAMLERRAAKLVEAEAEGQKLRTQVEAFEGTRKALVTRIGEIRERLGVSPTAPSDTLLERIDGLRAAERRAKSLDDELTSFVGAIRSALGVTDDKAFVDAPAEVRRLREYTAVEGFPPQQATRRTMGQLVRAVWVEWAAKQPNPKPSWLVSFDDLPPEQQEVDCRIGERLHGAGVRDGRLAERQALERAASAAPRVSGTSFSPPDAKEAGRLEERRVWERLLSEGYGRVQRLVKEMPAWPGELPATAALGAVLLARLELLDAEKGARRE